MKLLDTYEGTHAEYIDDLWNHSGFVPVVKATSESLDVSSNEDKKGGSKS